MLYVRETLDPDFTILRYETFCYPQVSPPEKDAAGRGCTATASAR
jgi:hypothetical protein